MHEHFAAVSSTVATYFCCAGPGSCKAWVAAHGLHACCQAAALNGTFDLFYLNFYTARYVSYQRGGLGEWGAGRTDTNSTFFGTDGKPIGGQTCAPDWFYQTPWALRKMLNWVDKRCVLKALLAKVSC